jgi:hypothetical protein
VSSELWSSEPENTRIDAMFSPTGIVRAFLATGTAVFAILGLVFRSDPRWFAASGLCGLLWGGWGLLSDHVLHPLAEWSSQFLFRSSRGAVTGPIQSGIQATIRDLEQRLEARLSRESDIRTARVLEEIYRTVRKDPANAARVIAIVRTRYPGAELEPGAAPPNSATE